jgi:2-amino-4-hydroxy-6-hydroxymethyldihydropteridine diphosphokinase
MDPYSSISDAIDILKNEVQLIKKGSVFCSNSWGYVGNDYLNQMIEVEWKDSLSDLMIFLLAVEKRMGRNRNLKSKDYEDRIIDLDIILWSEGNVFLKKSKSPSP